MHRVLERQLKRIYKDAVPDGIDKLLDVVSETYALADRDRELMDRSLDISSRELGEINEQLKKENRNIEQKIDERTEELQKKMWELEKFQRAVVGRELKMIELKEQVRELENKLTSLEATPVA